MGCEIKGLSIAALGVLILIITPNIPAISSIVLNPLDTSESIGPNSRWNSSVNPDIPNANSLVDLFEKLGYILSIILIIFGLFKYIRCI